MKPAGEWTYFWNPLCLFCQGDRTGWKGTSAIGFFFAHHVLNGEMRLSSCTLTVQDMIEPTHAFYKFTLHSPWLGLVLQLTPVQTNSTKIASPMIKRQHRKKNEPHCCTMFYLWTLTHMVLKTMMQFIGKHVTCFLHDVDILLVCLSNQCTSLAQSNHSNMNWTLW